MPLWTQHLIVAALVCACLTYCAYGMFRTFRGKRSRLGSCCAKGCPTSEHAADPAKNSGKVVFMPVEMLARRAKR